MPTSTIAAIRSEVPTGRSMKIRDGFMSRAELLVGLGGPARAAPAAFTVRALRASPLPAASAPLRRRRPIGSGRRTAVGRRRGDRPAGIAPRRARAADLGPVTQAVGAVDHPLVADRQTFDDGDLLTVGGAGLDDADLDRVVGLDAIDEGAGLAALDGGNRDGDGVLHRVDQQADIDELVGKQRL